MKRTQPPGNPVRAARSAKRRSATAFASGFAVGCSAYSHSIFAVIMVAVTAALIEICTVLRPVLLVVVEHSQWRKDQRAVRGAATPGSKGP